MPNSVYWDACIFIEVLQKTGKDRARLEACQDIEDKAKKGELNIVTSMLTITEVNKLDDLEKATGILREDQSKLILAFFENSYIHVRQLDRQTAELAHEFTRTHGLANTDAIHVATAILSKVGVLYTYDASKGRRRGLLTHNLKIGIPPLRIERPPPPSLGPLFDTRQADSPSAEPPAEANESPQS
jgi:predicted nucleic acid-binding protein